jgi:hypothetical protein
MQFQSFAFAWTFYFIPEVESKPMLAGYQENAQLSIQLSTQLLITYQSVIDLF